MYKNSIIYSIKTALAAIGFLLMTSVSDAQTTQKNIEDLKQKVQQNNREMDSLLEKTNQMMKEKADSINKASVQKSTERSYDWLKQYQQERRQKEKKKAIMYICFGVAGFAVLAYGLTRKRKKVS